MKQKIIEYLKSHQFAKRSDLREYLCRYEWISDRAMRKLIEEMIMKDGYCISSSEKGYSLITTLEQAEEARAYLKAKSEAIAVRGNMLIHNWNKQNKEQQLTLFN